MTEAIANLMTSLQEFYQSLVDGMSSSTWINHLITFINSFLSGLFQTELNYIDLNSFSAIITSVLFILIIYIIVFIFRLVFAIFKTFTTKKGVRF